MFRKLVLASVFLLLITANAWGGEEPSNDILIPVAGNTPGGFGSQWQTDLFVTNNSSRPEETEIAIALIREGADTLTVVRRLQPMETRIFRNVLRDTFGIRTGSGILRVLGRSVDSKLSARARIYNTGSALGEYSQTVPGVPMSQLSLTAHVSGLNGIAPNRTNVGISNPWNDPVQLSLSLFDASGEFRGNFTPVVSPRSIFRLGDVFHHFGTEALEGATVRVNSSRGVAVFASIVRSDSGDADYVDATVVKVAPAVDPIVAPACAVPAPLWLAITPAEGWIVIFKPGTDAAAAATALSTKYGFTVDRLFEALPALYARLSQQVIAQLRCESAVLLIEQNEVVPVP